jgi:hypothetical protein
MGLLSLKFEQMKVVVSEKFARFLERPYALIAPAY